MNYYMNLVSVEVSWKINTQPAATFVIRLLGRHMVGLSSVRLSRNSLLFYKRTYIWLCR